MSPQLREAVLEKLKDVEEASRKAYQEVDETRDELEERFLAEV